MAVVLVGIFLLIAAVLTLFVQAADGVATEEAPTSASCEPVILGTENEGK